MDDTLTARDARALFVRFVHRAVCHDRLWCATARQAHRREMLCQRLHHAVQLGACRVERARGY